MLLGFLVNLAGFLFSTGMANFFSSFATTLDIMVIQARFLNLGVLILISAGEAAGDEHVVGEVSDEHAVGGVGDEHVVGGVGARGPDKVQYEHFCSAMERW